MGIPQVSGASPRQLFGALLTALEDGITEWVCHPGYADGELRAMLPASEADRREVELQVLTDPDSRRRVEAAQARLVGYSRLQA